MGIRRTGSSAPTHRLAAQRRSDPAQRDSGLTRQATPSRSHTTDQPDQRGQRPARPKRNRRTIPIPGRTEKRFSTFACRASRSTRMPGETSPKARPLRVRPHRA